MKKTAAAAVSAAVPSISSGNVGNGYGASGGRPNIVLIMTDDQGYGDIGCHGNDLIRTPNLDAFAAESVEFTRFYTCPTCAPTRAGLLTGRYHHRTGVLGTMSGEALMDPGEVTIAEVLGGAGYATGIFGKWHLGDNYPRRPMDKGFRESLVHNGGGLSQPSCPPGVGYRDPGHWKKHGYVLYEPLPHWLSSNHYFDPVLRHNGRWKQYKGYCTDIFFDEAVAFIERHQDEPFFVYLPVNAPHAPEIVGEKYLAPYRAMGLDEKTARCYAMITNIDENFGRLRAKLKELDLERNTILIFMSDNGPQYDRYNAGLRGRKAHFYEGGIRVPFIISWPGGIPSPGKTDTIAANIDLFPTLLEACGVGKPAGLKTDGVSIMPLLTGAGEKRPERTLFFQGNHGVPRLYDQCAVVTQRYKLVNGTELYDLIEDPSESRNEAENRPAVVKELRSRYEAWFADVCASCGREPQRIYLGTVHENPVVLTPQDWRGPRSRFVRKDSLGYWEVDIRKAGSYRFTVRFGEASPPCVLHFSLAGVTASAELGKGETSRTFGPFEFGRGEARLEAWLETDGKTRGVRYVEVELL